MSASTIFGKVLQLIRMGCSLTPASAQATASESTRRFPTTTCTAATTCGHQCSAFIFHGASSPTEGIARECGSHLQVLLHKTGNNGESVLWQSNCRFCLQTQPQRSSRRLFFCSAGILVLFGALVVAILSMSAADSMPLISARLLPALLHSASRTVFHAQQCQVSGACHCQAVHRIMLCITATGPSHIQLAIRIAVPNALDFGVRFKSLLCHTPQLAQALVSCTLQRINKVPLGEKRQHNLSASTSAFRAPHSRNHGGGSRGSGRLSC